MSGHHWLRHSSHGQGHSGKARVMADQRPVVKLARALVIALSTPTFLVLNGYWRRVWALSGCDIDVANRPALSQTRH